MILSIGISSTIRSSGYPFVGVQDEWVICSGSQVEIKPPILDDPEHCYQWTPSSELCFTHSDQGYTALACPSETTRFKVVVTHEKDGFVGAFEMTVFVIEGILLEEDMRIYDCMEKTTLNFTATMEGKGLNKITTAFKIVFKYGGSKKGSSVSSINEKIKRKLTIDEVDHGYFHNDHAYGFGVSATFYAEDEPDYQCSDALTVTVHQLWIDEFKHTATDKPWQVVVSSQNELGDPQNHITGIAHTSPDCHSFRWQFTKNWELANAYRKEATDMYIPYDNHPLEHAWDNFGDTYGNVSFTATNRDGTVYTIYSYIIPDHQGRTPSFTHHESQLTPIWPRKKLAKVFFHKDETAGFTDPPQQPSKRHDFVVVDTDPNWYYYWKMITNAFRPHIVHLQHTHDVIRSSSEPGVFINGCNNDFGAGTFQFSQSTYVCDDSGDLSNITNSSGIGFFIETLAHENGHMVIMRNNWGSDFPTSYNRNLDIDKDFYNDDWEIATNKKLKRNIFTVGINDGNPLTGGNGQGYTNYEEPLCTEIENILHDQGLSSSLNSNDWSYDPYYKYHKNWE